MASTQLLLTIFLYPLSTDFSRPLPAVPASPSPHQPERAAAIRDMSMLV